MRLTQSSFYGIHTTSSEKLKDQVNYQFYGSAKEGEVILQT